MANNKTKPLSPKILQDDLDAFAALKNIAGYNAPNPDYDLGARTQVIAQFGDDSNEKQAVGLKKKSEYKSPTKKKTP